MLRSITPACTHAGLGSFLFARRYSGNRIFSFSSSGYLDVSVPRVPSTYLWIQYAVTEVCSARFPHSEITGSKDICSSPMLIAAYHVFHRLLVPRHPPYALYSLTKMTSTCGCGFPSTIHSVGSFGLRFVTFDTSFDVSLGCLDYSIEYSIHFHSICGFQGTYFEIIC